MDIKIKSQSLFKGRFLNKSVLFLFLLSFLGLVNTSHSQGSLADKTDELILICKSWGLVKYYHPEVQKGKYDMDEMLLDMIDQVQRDTDPNLVLRNWLFSLNNKRLGKRKKPTPNNNNYFEKNDYLDWIQESDILQTDIAEHLISLTEPDIKRKGYYATANSRVGNVKIIHEKKYTFDDTQDEKIRLLILFKYWNVIEYFFPYKYQMDADWGTILHKYIPVFIDARSRLDFQLAFLSLTVEIDDSHGNFYTEDILSFFGEKYVPAFFDLIEDQITITGYYDEELSKKNNLLLGDQIIMIDSVSIKERIAYLNRYIPGSNQSRKIHNLRYCLLKGNKDSVEIVLIRDSDTLNQIVKRYEFNEFKMNPFSKEKWEVLEGDILLVRFWRINGKDIKPIKEILKESRGLVLDLRVYPKFFIHDMIVGIIKQKPTKFYRDIIPDFQNPGKFKYTAGRSTGPQGKDQFDGDVVVLVDKGTISYAEFIAMDLQSCKNVVVVGRQTAGAVGTMSIFEVVNGVFTSFTGTGVFYPDGSDVQRNGVNIDYKVEPTLDEVTSGEDIILNRALEIFNSGQIEPKR